MKTKLFITTVFILYTASGYAINKYSPCSFLLINPTLIHQFEPLGPKHAEPLDQNINDEDDSEFSETKDEDTPNRRRLSDTLVQSLTREYLSPDGVVTLLEIKETNLSESLKEQIKAGFAEPNCYSIPCWREFLTDESLLKLITHIYMNLLDTPTASAQILQEKLQTLPEKFPSENDQTCFPAWILRQIAYI